MVKIIDHYGHWNKNRGKKAMLLDREIKSLNFISSVSHDKKSFIDLGSGNGDFLNIVKNKLPSLKLKGLDYSKSEVAEARKRGFDVQQGNFEEGIKIKSKSFDIAYAAEILEHLYNTDLFLSETNRILKDGGYLILSTPNLLAWFNRILVPLGVQPLYVELSTKSKLIGSGPLKRLKKEPNPVGHVRVFTPDGLKDILEMNGFKIIKIRGAIYQEGLPKSLWQLDRILSSYTRLASDFVVLAKKVR